MKQFTRVVFSPVSPEQAEWLVALLSQQGYDGFEEGERSLTTYIPGDQFDLAVLQDLAGRSGLAFALSTLEETNWNAAWESGFEPVTVTDPETGRPWAAIRAEFHQPVEEAVHDIVITPRMSFGTGHHATTYQMVEQMKELDLRGKTVLDFGTGTGVLAILAMKLGAAAVDAIDNDEWSISNARDNMEANGAKGIELILAENAQTGKTYDVILANINRNVIADNLSTLAAQLAPGGILLLSGFLPGDLPFMQERCGGAGFRFIHSSERNNWVCLRFVR